MTLSRRKPKREDFLAVLRSYQSGAMREAARRFRQHKAFVEATRPLTGVYWWVPERRGKGFTWRVLAFYESVYGEQSHAKLWPQVLDSLSGAWKKRSFAELEDAYAALPRGRVVKARDSEYVLLHGNDSPGALSAVMEAFRLRPGHGHRVMVDDHERTLADDVQRLQMALGVDLGIEGA